MKITIILAFLIASTNTFSQEKNFSLEIGYPIELSNGNSSGLTGIINSRIKYRFWNTESFGIGTSYSIDLLTGNITSENKKESFTSHHFNLFGEVPLNSSKTLFTSLGAGYTTQSYYITKIMDHGSGLISSETEKTNVGGFNIDIGGSYDILKNFFIQGTFQFIRLYVNDFLLEEKIGFNKNRLKVGVGYRF